MNWTDERVELLKKLWSEGLSASQIATQLGGVSRNAVIGKVHRLKLSGRGRASSATPRPKKTAPSAPKAPRPSRPVTTTIGATALQARFDAQPETAPAPRLSSVVVPLSRNLKLIELSERTCKWPNGDPLAEEFSFCGNDVGDCGPYCAYHARAAYQPVAERRRRG
ncbi:GcrA family cell cycle regulator [Aliihoeflea sp. 40Bstr573]|uniref:GcrA family cell cycle regulator n=1 Tax=Aliihoeflea sp. 40Bstr573 TaxID=2696467 RepID=UPI002095FB15|nr:GcrA family cell cycle regulator [Aliihoeflea sp. 40Bstr573]MCO6389057.1 GcrA cell cycle regulator [Aliihoeflea sp. 40Bstr573]